MGGFLVIVIIVMVRNPPMIMMTIWSSWRHGFPMTLLPDWTTLFGTCASKMWGQSRKRRTFSARCWFCWFFWIFPECIWMHHNTSIKFYNYNVCYALICFVYMFNVWCVLSMSLVCEWTPGSSLEAGSPPIPRVQERKRREEESLLEEKRKATRKKEQAASATWPSFP